MKIKIKSIKIGDNRRSIEVSEVEKLADSINEIGLINPITVNDDMTLIAGAHRLEACKLLGFQEIDANVIGLNELLAELAEIDENLIRNELFWTEQDNQLARRKTIYLALYPETGQGKHDNRGNQYTNGKTTKCRSSTFAEDAADKIGVSERTVQRSISRAEKIDDEIKPALKELDATKNEGDMLKKYDSDEQRRIVDNCKLFNKTISEELKDKERRERKYNSQYRRLKEQSEISIIDIIDLNKKAIPYDSNMYYISSDQVEERYGDKVFSLTDDKWYTLTTLERFYHRETGREFSMREYADVQTFPNDYIFVGNKSTIKKQIGNAVAPDMGAYISENLKGKTVGDLFAGAGGFTCGLHKNGIKSLWAIEWDQSAAQAYKLNWPEVEVINGNITAVNTADLKKVDIIVGGPPCQGFSNAGTDAKADAKFGNDPRNLLYLEFVRIVNDLRPAEFIMENVKEIECVKDEIISDFNDIGYTVETRLVAGNDIGMKQNRKRFFFIGKLISE